MMAVFKLFLAMCQVIEHLHFAELWLGWLVVNLVFEARTNV